MTSSWTELQQAVRRALRSVPDLAAVLQAAEAEHRRLTPYGILMLLALLLPFVGFVLGSPFGRWGGWIGFGAGALLLVAYWIWYSNRVDALTTAVKERAVVPALGALGFRLQETVPEELASRQRVVLADVFSAPKVELHHPTAATLGGRAIQVAHAAAQRYMGRGLYRTVFSGLVATAAAPTVGQRVLVVREMGVLGALEDVKRRLAGLRRVELPDPTFEALYTVYAQSEDLSAALHPFFRDALVQLGQVPRARPVVAFHEGQVHVFLPRREWLNPAAWDRVSEDQLSSDLEALLQASFLAAVAAGASPQEVLASVRELTV
ncbi:MAG: DUF3137 domain-containing protein [Armatimonadota bacterium]|nr:DUF3137 domain-containing protein [Armatimonadota bacterium]MDR7444372.1 DUF3137 domain-containing protein [Armatimonadota bacterium]MDR7570729.1 DUF3137 domain-containing protein [Armatimonadota bacterium]MDR7614859.1 DUF3137 domain-containing protein [Armatimonadota bacterium]